MKSFANVKARIRGAISASWIGAALASVPLAEAQTPGATVMIPSGEQPVRGPGQSSPFLSPDNSTSWSLPQVSGPNVGWKFILLADIDGDGRDDLCGLFGLSNGHNVYGCVKNIPDRTFSGNLIQANAFNGPPDPSIHSTIRPVDLNGNGGKHLCGRTMEGVKCQHFGPAGFEAAVLVHAEFSDANFWNQEQYYSTIAFGKLDQTLTLCGRGTAGVKCFKKLSAPDNQGRLFSTAALTQPAFSDANGWIWPQYYRTLQYIDVDRDGNSDLCGRGISGMVCSVWRPDTHQFAPLVLWLQAFGDGTGFTAAKYYLSIRIADINGAGLADVCGRGTLGFFCAINASPSGHLLAPFGLYLAQPQMTDAARWGVPPEMLSSLHVVDFDRDGKNDVCGLVQLSAQGSPDILCGRSRSDLVVAKFDPLVKRTGSVVTTEKVVAGRLYDTPGAPRAIGFCWTTTSRSVSCSLEWR